MQRDPKVNSVFEVLGGYFTDTFFNHIYNSSRVALTSGKSLTDEYGRHVQAYIIGVKNDAKCYGEVVRSLHEYFTTVTRHSVLSFASFVDRIVGVCVPPEYFQQFTAEDKDELLSSVLCDLVSNLGVFVTKPEVLRLVIDEHDRSSAATIRMIQDAAVSGLFAKRTAIYNRFLRKASQAREHVSVDVVEEMKVALRRLAKEKAEAVKRAAEAEEELRASKTREAKLRRLVDMLRVERARGPTAAAALARVPPRELLAEDPLDLTRQESSVPARERIAEQRVAERSERTEQRSGRDERSERTEQRSGRDERGATRQKPQKPARAALDASFFQGGLPPGASASASASGGTTVDAIGSVVNVATAVPPSAITDLLANIVDLDADPRADDQYG